LLDCQSLADTLSNDICLSSNSRIFFQNYSLPSEEAVTIALRTQQIMAHESGVANCIDPLGGAYFVEKLTKEMEEEAKEYIRKIDDMGGMVKAIEFGFPQKEIADSAYKYQKAVEKKDKIIVGVNAFQMEHEPIPTLQIDESVAKQQLARLKEVKKTRNNAYVKKNLLDLQKAAENDENLMPFILNCVKSYATLGEIIDSLKKIYAEYQEPITY